MSAISSRYSSPSPKECFPDFFLPDHADPLTGEHITDSKIKSRASKKFYHERKYGPRGDPPSEDELLAMIQREVSRRAAEGAEIMETTEHILEDEPIEPMPDTPVPWYNPYETSSDDHIPLLYLNNEDYATGPRSLTLAPYHFEPTDTPCETPPSEAEVENAVGGDNYQPLIASEQGANFDIDQLHAALESSISETTFKFRKTVGHDEPKDEEHKSRLLVGSEQESDWDDCDFHTPRTSSNSGCFSTPHTVVSNDEEPHDSCSEKDDVEESMACLDILDFELDDEDNEPTSSSSGPPTPDSTRSVVVSSIPNQDDTPSDLIEEVARNDKTLALMRLRANGLNEYNRQLRHEFAATSRGDVPKPRTPDKMFREFDKHPEYFSASQKMTLLERQKLEIVWKGMEMKYWQEENDEISSNTKWMEEWVAEGRVRSMHWRVVQKARRE